MSAINLVWWETVLHWKPSRGDFGILFWIKWKNHMASEGRKVIAAKRPSSITPVEPAKVFDWASPAEYDLDRYVTYTDDPNETVVISMLSLGYQSTEVRKVVGRHSYYRIINAWRTAKEEE